MKVFVFDTETTGFINKKDPSLDSQPKIVQFAGILGNLENGKWTEEKRVNILINPKMSIPFDSSKVHHIYDIDVKNAPFIEEKIDEFLTYINDSDVIVGHNIEYDEDMIKIELRRLESEYKYQPKQVVCTMKTTVDFCAIKGNGERFKYPKLGELHKKLFEEYFIGAHDAMVDVEATVRCFVELVNKEILKIEKKKKYLLYFNKKFFMSTFGDLVNIEEFEKREQFKEERGKVSFYCKDCKNIVETERPNPTGYIFICKKCNGKNIAIGTEEGLKSNYKIKSSS